LLTTAQSFWPENISQAGASIQYIYQTQFVENVLIDTVQIDCDLNSTNYFHLEYSRAEGILLSMDVEVDVPGGLMPGVDLLGSFQLTQVSQSYSFAPSTWNYVFWFAIIFGLVIVVLSGFSIVFTGMQQSVVSGKKIIDKPRVELKAFIAFVLMIVGLVYISNLFGLLVAVVGIAYLTYSIVVLPDHVSRSVAGVILFYFITVGIPLLVNVAVTATNFAIAATSPFLQGFLNLLGGNAMSLIAFIIGALGALFGVFVRIKAWNAAQRLA
jgi:MFS family permease